ncbi:hypothetical protein JCM16303_007270 [Sporobolomyces ruberrimus]
MLFSSRRRSVSQLVDGPQAHGATAWAGSKEREADADSKAVQYSSFSQRDSRVRSKSSTRATHTERTERDRPPLPTKDVQYDTARRLPPGAMPSRPPTAQYHAVTSPSPPGSLPARHRSSQGRAPPVAPPASRNTSTTSRESAPFHATTPPIPSQDGEEVFVLGRGSEHSGSPGPRIDTSRREESSDLQHNPQYLYTPPRQTSHRFSTNPPVSSSAKLARSFSSTPTTGLDYSAAAHTVVGLASSSSFYGASPSPNDRSLRPSPAQSPQTSPRTSQLPQRQSSFMQKMQDSCESLDRRQTFAATTPHDDRQDRAAPFTCRKSPSDGLPLPVDHHVETSPPLRIAAHKSQTPSDHAMSSTVLHPHYRMQSNEVPSILQTEALRKIPPPSVSPINTEFQALPIDTTPPRTSPLPSRLSRNDDYVPVRSETTASDPLRVHPEGLDTRAFEYDFRASQQKTPMSNGSPQRHVAHQARGILASAGFTSTTQLPLPRSPSRLSPALDLAKARAPLLPPQSQSPDRQTSSTTGGGSPRAAALAAARERQAREPPRDSRRSSNGASDSAQATTPEGLGPPKNSSRRIQANGSSRMEVAFSLFAQDILRSLLSSLSYQDVVSLHCASRTMRRILDADGRELILERFLGAQGYRSYAPRTDPRHTLLPPDDLVTLDLRDLAAFRAAQSLSLDDYNRFSRAYLSGQLSAQSLRLARASTRAWNRVVLRLRAQTILPASSLSPLSFPGLRQIKHAYKAFRAPDLRVWVPTSRGESWMNDQEIVECERELWRSGKGVWSQLRRGDLVTNVAIEAFGNCGRTIFDGRFLRDLSFEFDVIGHLPNWLNMLTLSPSFYHNILACSSSNPVFYLSLSSFSKRLRETLHLESDSIAVASPQGMYSVKRHVYRAVIEIQAGHVLETIATSVHERTDGFEVCHEDWAGKVIFETEGTTEHASLLIARVASKSPTPWKIVREKSRPHCLYIKPVLDK